MNIFNELVVEPDLEWEFIDGSIVTFQSILESQVVKFMTVKKLQN